MDHPLPVFQFTEADLRTSQRLHAMASLMRWPRLFVTGCIGVLVIAVMSRSTLFSKDGILVCVVTFFASAGIGTLTGWLVMMLLLPFKSRRTFRMQRSLHGDIEIGWNTEGLKASTGMGQSIMKWTDYVRWRENAAVILLYHSDNLFQFIPKRVLSPQQDTSLRQAATAAGLRGTQ